MNHTELSPEITLHHNKTTDVAFVDLLPRPEGRIDVIDVSETLGVGTTVLARFDSEGNLVGLTIENYKHFRREVMRRYLALAVDRIIGLMVDRVRSTFAHHGSHGMATCAG